MEALVLELPTVDRVERSLLLEGAGFFFAFRIALTWIAFQSDPVLGSMCSIGVVFALLVGAVAHSTGGGHPMLSQKPVGATRWIYALVGLSLLSLSWTGAAQTSAAAAYWAGMAAEVILVLFVLRDGRVVCVTRSLMKGFVVGACGASLVAWCSPVTVELRLGNDLYLHPNTLGMTCALGAFLAQFLSRTGGPGWKWAAMALVVTLARTLSKTAILAYVIAEAWYLLANREIARRTKLALVGAATVLGICLAGVIAAYFDIYNTTGGGTQAETLTGRTIVWATAISMGMERPRFGHGMYSFRSLIPTFGNFLPIHAHNEWIHLFFELGVVGLVVGAGAYVGFYRQAQRARASELRLLCLSLVIFTVLHSFTDTVPYGLSFPLWLMTALSVWLKQEEEAH